MDAELKHFLDQKFNRIDAKFDGIDAKFNGIDGKFASMALEFNDKLAAMERRFDDKQTAMAQHILHETHLRFDTVGKRLDSIDSRLKLQAGLIQVGARAITRLSEAAESNEARYVDLLAKFENLEFRVMRLENPKQ